VDGDDDLAVLVAAFAAKADRIEPIRGRISLYFAAIASSGVLRGRHAEQHETSRRQLSEAVAGRRGRARPDAACELVAELALLVLERSVQRWAGGPGGRSLPAALARELKLLRTVSSGSPG
jgi:hypothetical protein